MKIVSPLLIAAVTACPLAVFATSNPENPAAAAPPVVYSSAFDGYRTTPSSDVTPDRYWRIANEKAATSGMHHAGTEESGHAESHAGHDMNHPDQASMSMEHHGHHHAEGK